MIEIISFEPLDNSDDQMQVLTVVSEVQDGCSRTNTTLAVTPEKEEQGQKVPVDQRFKVNHRKWLQRTSLRMYLLILDQKV